MKRRKWISGLPSVQSTRATPITASALECSLVNADHQCPL